MQSNIKISSTKARILQAHHVSTPSLLTSPVPKRNPSISEKKETIKEKY
jgi:hypothetical protein